MPKVFAIGVGHTPFRRQPERSFRDLARQALSAALDDAALDGTRIEAISFGNCALGTWGQANVRGQVVLEPMLRDGTLTESTPILNVEGGCGTGSLALRSAWTDILAGAGITLALGVEKTWVPDDPRKTLELFLHGVDHMHEGDWAAFVTARAAEVGEVFDPHPFRVPFVDVHALHARRHMSRYGTTAEQLAQIASKNHAHGALNPDAQYRKEMTPEQILADKPVVAPFTQSMCAPVSDGAAAVVLCSEAVLATLDPSVRERAVEVRTVAVVGGTWRSLDAPNVLAHAADKAWKQAGLGPEHVGVAEVHDASSFCELQATELLGFCEVGEGGAYAESGATTLQGDRPVNPSGGLESKGHPLAATGLGMIDELVRQLRKEAGDRQAAGEPTVAVAHNAGGMVGVDEAVCAVTVLAR